MNDILVSPSIDTLEKHFIDFRKNIIGINATFQSPYGIQKIIYADWTASGRFYEPIEKRIAEEFGPYIGNTHSESSETGKFMTRAYHEARQIIRRHVNASDEDVVLTTGFGMTGALAKLQRILGFKGPQEWYGKIDVMQEEKPVVFITHMEHHSNQVSWLETIADVVIIEPDHELLVDPENLEKALKKYEDRKVKIGSFTACSNVTGVSTPYHKLAKIMHDHGGVCFVDFAASAPYASINMHPKNHGEHLDAIFFSPHKFLGGPGSSGVLVFNRRLYSNAVPDLPGGGTVAWTNPWGGRSYINDIEAREDGGTPGFIQAIKTALSIKLKEKMGVGLMHRREKLLLKHTFRRLSKIEGLYILAENVIDRFGSVSFYVENIHYHLIVQLLNDRFGIQVRGGCSCAGTYGHMLLKVSKEQSHKITSRIDEGDQSEKPGWVRLSLHPTMTDGELDYILDAIQAVVENIEDWQEDYQYSAKTNEFTHKAYRNGAKNISLLFTI